MISNKFAKNYVMELGTFLNAMLFNYLTSVKLV